MKGIYHIQHINGFHSNFKSFLQKFRGVSTKHLNSYLKWFKWIELFKNEKELLKIQKAYIPVSYTHLDVHKRQMLCWFCFNFTSCF